MTAVIVEDVGLVDPMPPPRWVVAARGVLWLLGAAAVLSFSTTSVAVIAAATGVLIILAGCDEMAEAATAHSWRWAHATLGVVFLVSGFIALFVPWRTFGILALFLGWYLVVKGIMDVVLAIGLRGYQRLWGLSLAVGIGTLLVGMWVLAYPRRSPWLLILWIGLGALLRGSGDLIRAFTGRTR
jgi:uncharacterized membrane protein HdeD (DUF308 family)